MFGEKKLPNHFDDGPWKEISWDERIRVIEVANLAGFCDFVNRLGVGGTNDEHIWRGQRRAEWEITSTLLRTNKAQFEGQHLTCFVRALATSTNIKYDISDDNPQAEETKRNLWSLGQHWGLATPLIDFTIYPFFALFFAFAELDEETKQRAVFALDTGMIPPMNFQIVEMLGREAFKRKLDSPPYDEEFKMLLSDYMGIYPSAPQTILDGTMPEQVKKRICEIQHQQDEKKALKWFRPLSGDNPRVHSQGGLHVLPPENISLEAWTKLNHQTYTLDPKPPLLTKILIPNSERNYILETLNRMGVNYTTIFPDIEGAVRHCNLALKQGRLGLIRDY
jgi:hypothetical protein